MDNFYDYESLMKYKDEKFGDIKPKNIPENISTLISDKIWKTMSDKIQKDLQEMFDAYHFELWTATILMAYNIQP
ncbi:hypothetical protein AGMMS50212_16830 [Spirochaetia bacterium]|nr:hypothetical protein AGMMS50212_16830 [Spirochaetia bacterium]